MIIMMMPPHSVVIILNCVAIGFRKGLTKWRYHHVLAWRGELAAGLRTSSRSSQLQVIIITKVKREPPSRKRLNDLSLQNVILVPPLSEDLRSFASASVVNSLVEEQEVKQLPPGAECQSRS